MSSTRLVSLFSIALPLTFCPEAGAQNDKGGVRAVADSKEPAPPGDLSGPDEILVVGRRYGEAKVAAESEFSEEEIASHGADSIQDLLRRLQPIIGDGEEEPVLLINGQPAGFDRSILAFPAEALDRLAVLKPEAAARYGHPSGQRVVNLVLKKHFSSLNADAGASLATGGGQYGGSLSVGRAAIDGPARWNVQARASYDSALRKSARNIPPRPGTFDGTGYVSAPEGGEVDPALSHLAGRPVATAAIPPGAMSKAPLLADFIATVGDSHALDPNEFETLLPSRRSMALGIGLTRPLGSFSVSLSADASRSSSRAMRGLPMTSIIVPADSPWSPFAGDVLLTRPFAGARALRSNTDSESIGTSLSLTGMIGDWQASFSASYSRSWTRSLLESGIDATRAQQLLDSADPAFNPYRPWDERLLLARRNRSRGESITSRLNVKRNVLNLPAGPVTANLSVNAGRSRSESRQGDNLGGSAVRSGSALERLDGAFGLSLPLSRPGEGEIMSLGSLDLDLTASAQTMTRSRLQKRYGGDLNWSPTRNLRFRGSIGHAETAPSFGQLDDPIVTTINRIFDYSRGEVAEPVWITGGNPALGRGSQQSLALEAMVRPLGNQTVTLNAAYRQDTAKGGVAGFPELTPVIEAAFPERVTRDADGRLIAVDARPINIARATDSELSSSVALRFPGKPVANATQLSFSLRHRWRLKSELLTHPGVPVIDQLTQSGQSRHSLSFQTTAGQRGWGATFGGNWSGASRVENGDRTLNTKPPVIFNLTLFVEPEHLAGQTRKSGLLDNLKITLAIQNVFNGYRRVTLQDGTIPAGFSRDEIDPLGRIIRLTLRKRL
ncbi:hypothetical protein [Sphingomonas sp.]|uniref:hypothetical protein n=1 Tax=Sphingomonas sp. TaxID=28214 RepID=UPI002ED8F5DF